jgi:hypothetical protein
MKKIILRKYTRYYWGNADVEIYDEAGTLTRTIEVNQFHDVKDDFIFIYETVGGSGTGYNPGPIQHKISLKDFEFETITQYERNEKPH